MWKKIIMIGFTVYAFTGCEKEKVEEPVDCNANPVEVELVSTTDSNCASDDGEIEVAGTGGDGSYKYSLDGGASQSSPIFSSLAAGLYDVTVTDGNNCSGTLEVEVRNREGLNISVEAQDAGCKKSEGSLTITAVDGPEPYTYKLDNGTFGTTNTFTGLPNGDHAVTVRDAGGCEVTQNVRLASGVSFATSISPIIETKCAVSGCHSGTQPPDFRSFSNIHANAANIKTLTANGTMPQNGSLTQEQKDLIACWVDDGALQN
jgi:hypothetical protein